MVYTKHLVIHTFDHLTNSIDYSTNEEKTASIQAEEDSHLENIFPYLISDNKTILQQLVSANGIVNPKTAYDEFVITKMNAAYAKGTKVDFDMETGEVKPLTLSKLEEGNAVLAHHLIQSFSPDDQLTPEEIHELGRKTVLELTGGEYEFVIATHVDKEHIHNHIIFNSTNLMTGNSFRWQKGTKKIFEQISDKHASKAGAKIIEKSPKNSHKKYTMWQTESIYKSKIKSRLDYLISHSNSIPDLLEKAAALHLQIDLSGKWATYRLLDEPQVKNTRSRALSKTNPEKYNYVEIENRLKENEHVVSVEEVVAAYEEKVDDRKNDFDYQVIIESWQLSHKTEKGYYINVDFGSGNHGQIFVGAYKVDELEDDNYSLYIKKDDFFYFMNEEKSERSRYMTGETLMKQLSLYNGTVPIKKEPVLRTINELVDAINFLAEHGATTGSQVILLEQKLEVSMDEAHEKLKELDKKIIELSKTIKSIQLSDGSFDEESTGFDDEPTIDQLKEELESVKLGRGLLQKKFTETVDQLNKVHGIQFVAKKDQPDNQLKK